MAIHDITLPISETLAGWPGDAPYRFTWTCRIAAGASVNVGEMAMSIHTGTHADAPCHFADGEASIESVDLEAYVGPALVVDVRGPMSIDAPLLRAAIGPNPPARLILRTGGWTDHSRFPDAIPTLTLDAVDLLGECGIRLLGLDVPSVDALDSKPLPNHHALGRRRIAIVESLDLSRVEPGTYELIALPLRIVGADGSPLRAVLRDLE